MKNAARFFKVLSDEARLRMLWLLFNHDELCVCDIMAVLDITQSKASRHLGALRHAGLVTDRKEGLWSYYKLCRAKDTLVRRQLEILRESLANRKDAVSLVEKLSKRFGAKIRGDSCAEAKKKIAVRSARPSGKRGSR